MSEWNWREDESGRKTMQQQVNIEEAIISQQIKTRMHRIKKVLDKQDLLTSLSCLSSCQYKIVLFCKFPSI